MTAFVSMLVHGKKYMCIGVCRHIIYYELFTISKTRGKYFVMQKETKRSTSNYPIKMSIEFHSVFEPSERIWCLYLHRRTPDTFIFTTRSNSLKPRIKQNTLIQIKNVRIALFSLKLIYLCDILFCWLSWKMMLVRNINQTGNQPTICT